MAKIISDAPVKCKYCDCENLRWAKTSKGKRQVYPDGTIHKCFSSMKIPGQSRFRVDSDAYRQKQLDGKPIS